MTRSLLDKCRASRLPADCEQYVHQCSVVINLIKSLKSEYYSSIIKENSGTQKVLFKTTVNYYPLSENDRMLAGEFATFFTAKIDTLHKNLLVKRRLSLTRLNVLLMRYLLCLRLNFQLLLR